MKKLLLGNEAIARGAYEASVCVVSAYPGTPSTEISEYIIEYNDIYAEWAPNEKVAAEVAIGASIAGGRSLCAMKHVGLNVAADPIFTASYTGVNAGFVICVADDMGMHSSQNEQDSRHYAKAAKVLMLEPSDSAECKDFMKAAFDLSEEYDTPVFIRLSTRISHSRSMVLLNEPLPIPLKEYKKDISKYVMMPAAARARHKFVEERILRLKEWADTTPLNYIEGNNKKFGVISSGIAYRYAKEALGDNAAYLKLGAVYPLPERKIKEFANSVEVCYVIEELDPVIEDFCKSIGVIVIGKDRLPLTGEYTAAMIADVIRGEKRETYKIGAAIPGRPPVMCAGCPHRGVFLVLSQLGLTVCGDIGCYTLGALPPLNAMDTCVCMGAGVGMAHGMEKAKAKSAAAGTVAVIGDSTFIHSGITGLIDIVYNKGASTVIILDNAITGMTGHQDHPATGKTIRGDTTYQINIEKLCEAVGVKRVFTVDAYDIEQVREAVKREVSMRRPSVIIAKRPCALLKGVSYPKRYTIDQNKCKKCKACVNPGCPAISVSGGDVLINKELCAGCSLCMRVCRFGAVAECGADGGLTG